MTYKEFLKEQEKSPMDVAIKHSDAKVSEKLMSDIFVPDFYRDVASLESVVFYQGSHFVDKPHYEKQEQIICAIDGALSIALVPHVFRQEVYAQDHSMSSSVYHDPGLWTSKDYANTSPVNFFMPNL